MSTVLTSIITALVTAGILGIAKSRHLYLLVPKMHFYSPLSTGTTIQITLINGGFRTEENININLNHGAKYELLAASRSDISIDASRICLPRLNRFSRATILFVAEGKPFDRADITAVDSKETVGKIIEKAADASSLSSQFVGAALLLLFVSAAFLYGTWFGSEVKTNLVSYIADQLVYDQNPIKASQITFRGDDEIRKAPKLKQYRDQLPIRVDNIFRKGDTILFSVVAKNLTDDYMLFGASAKSPSDERDTSFRDRAFYDLMIGPNETREIKMSMRVPVNSKVKLIVVDFTVSLSDPGNRFHYSETLEFN